MGTAMMARRVGDPFLKKGLRPTLYLVLTWKLVKNVYTLAKHHHQQMSPKMALTCPTSIKETPDSRKRSDYLECLLGRVLETNRFARKEA